MREQGFPRASALRGGSGGQIPECRLDVTHLRRRQWRQVRLRRLRRGGRQGREIFPLGVLQGGIVFIPGKQQAGCAPLALHDPDLEQDMGAALAIGNLKQGGAGLRVQLADAADGRIQLLGQG